jgi:signal peptidase I
MTKKRILSALKLAATLLWWGALLLTLVSVVVCLAAHFRGEVPRLFGLSVLHIVSDSMEPTIARDSYILIRAAEPAEVKRDDVICFYSTDPQIYGYPNTHRVVEEPTVVDGEYRYVTQGDKSPTVDRHPAEGDRLIGIFVCELGLFTALMHFITQNMFLLFAVLFLLVAASTLIPLFLKKGDGETQK